MATEENPDRLDSWKEIGSHLKRDVRTVRRWERQRALPVHRLPGAGRRAVFAYRAEIDDWLRGPHAVAGRQSVAVAAPPTAERAPSGKLAASDPRAALPDSAASPADPRIPTDRREEPSCLLTSGRAGWPAPDARNEPVLEGRGRAAARARAAELFADRGWLWGAALMLAGLAWLGAFGLRLPSWNLASAPIPAGTKTTTSNTAGEHSSSATWRPEVLQVQFRRGSQGLSMDVDGLGFGETPTKLPYTGDVPWFCIGDETCYGAAPGTCEAGYTGDDFPLTYHSWSSSQIVISGYKVAAPGDAIELAVWNPQAKSQQDAAVWGGNVPPVRPGTPQISSVTFGGSGKNLHFTIQGRDFGKSPPGVPGAGDTSFFEIGDYAYHAPEVQFSIFFRAGYRSNSVVNSITLLYDSWSNNRIEIGGFGGTYGLNGMVVRRGDPISIELWNTTNHLATAWGGRVP